MGDCDTEADWLDDRVGVRSDPLAWERGMGNLCWNKCNDSTQDGETSRPIILLILSIHVNKPTTNA